MPKVYSSLVLPSSKWTNQTVNPSVEILLCKVGERHTLCGSESQFEGSVILTVKINKDFNWQLIVNGADVSATCDAVKHLPQPLKPDFDINAILVYLDGLLVCPGNPDEHFMKMAEDRPFKSECAARVDSTNMVTMHGKVNV